jgi:tetratricopeptide (TPR) repeat protein
MDKLNRLPINHPLETSKLNPYVLTAKEKHIVDCYNKEIIIYPNNEQLWLDLGDFYTILGIYHGKNFRNKALDCYNNASKLNFTNIEPILKKARYYYRYSEGEKAIEQCDINTNSWEAWYIKGLAYGDLDNQEEAMKCFNESLKINKSNSEALNGMASIIVKNIYKSLNDKEWRRQHIKFRPTLKSEFDEAEKYLELSKNLSNDSKSYLISKGDYFYVYGYYNKELASNEDEIDIYKNLLNISHDSYSMAWKFYTDALILDPSYGKLWDRVRDLLGAQDHRYVNAYNHASKMAQEMGYIG